jgi:GT2 family glycosyltransferase
VIVVDDCSRAEQQLLLRDIISEFKNLNVKLFCYSKQVGTSDAKNLGILKTRTPYIWFLDSDTEMINPDAFEVGYQLLDKDPSIGVVGAEIVEDSKHQRYVRETCLLKSLWSAYIHHPVGNDVRKKVDVVHTCNFLTRTDLMKKIGGFCAKLSDGEDKLACLQIRELGYRIFLDSRFGVLHHRAPTERAQLFTRVRVNLRDAAFIYGAISSFWKLAVFHIDCMFSLWKFYTSTMEMRLIFVHHQDALDIDRGSCFLDRVKRLRDIGKIMVQYVLANKTYMLIKGYCFRITSKINPQTVEDRTMQHSKSLIYES